jgi:hypothetical protein
MAAKYNKKLTPQLRNKLSEAIAKGHSIEGACGTVGINRTTYYDWYHKGENEEADEYVQFKCAMDNAHNEATHLMESIVIESAVENVKDAKWWLTKRRPDIYADKIYNETKLEADVKSEVTVNLLEKMKQKRGELNDLNKH